MAVQVKEVFKHIVKKACLSRKSPIAVAVSGGCDSMVLLWMAKQAFTNVVGLTVDHRLCASSTEEAVRAGELVEALGVRHQVLSLEWDGSVASTITRARSRSYDALLDYCKSSGMQTLMTAHHLDDQIATLLFRMSKGTGTNGLAGMHDIELSQYMDYLSIQMVRPFLSCRKEQLVAVCKEAGLEWVDNLTNSHAPFSKHYIGRLLENDPALCQGLYHMHSTLDRTRTQALHGKVGEIVHKLTYFNTKYGYVCLNRPSLLQLPKPILREVMNTLLKFVSADISPVRPNILDNLISDLPNLNTNATTMLHNCFVFLLDQDTVCMTIATSATDAHLIKPVPIVVGEQQHWIGKWMIELSPLSETSQAKTVRKQYLVRPFNNKRDAHLLRHGVRVIRSAKLPPLKTRSALPVVADEDGNVVAIPHFNYNNRIYGIKASVKYNPLISLDYALKCNSTPANNC